MGLEVAEKLVKRIQRQKIDELMFTGLGWTQTKKNMSPPKDDSLRHRFYKHPFAQPCGRRLTFSETQITGR